MPYHAFKSLKLENLSKFKSLVRDLTANRNVTTDTLDDLFINEKIRHAYFVFNSNRELILQCFKALMSEHYLCNSANVRKFYRNSGNTFEDLDFYELCDVYKNYFISMNLYNHDPLMLQLNLMIFSSSHNKLITQTILKDFCNQIEFFNSVSSYPGNYTTFLENCHEEEAYEDSLQNGLKCLHCQGCKLCSDWLCEECLKVSGLNKHFYCSIFKEHLEKIL